MQAQTSLSSFFLEPPSITAFGPTVIEQCTPHFRWEGKGPAWQTAHCAPTRQTPCFTQTKEPSQPGCVHQPPVKSNVGSCPSVKHLGTRRPHGDRPGKPGQRQQRPQGQGLEAMTGTGGAATFSPWCEFSTTYAQGGSLIFKKVFA